MIILRGDDETIYVWPAEVILVPRGPGRPRIHPDRKAYRAKKAKEYRERDKLKAAKESK